METRDSSKLWRAGALRARARRSGWVHSGAGVVVADAVRNRLLLSSSICTCWCRLSIRARASASWVARAGSVTGGAGPGWASCARS